MMFTIPEVFVDYPNPISVTLSHCIRQATNDKRKAATNITRFSVSTLETYVWSSIFNLAKHGYCNHFICLSVCFMCVQCVYMLHNTWYIIILYHEVFIYFLLGSIINKVIYS